MRDERKERERERGGGKENGTEDKVAPHQKKRAMSVWF